MESYWTARRRAVAVLGILAIGCTGAPASSTAGIPADSGQQDTVPLGEHEARPPGTLHEVVLTNAAFYPLVTEARAGDRVRWTSRASSPRTVVSGFACVPDGIFASPALPPLGTFEVRLPVAGPFPYFALEDCDVAGAVSVSP